ncbi:hypothetical protein SKAU_G00286160 [Synaphobranchus kaupii]|uniref:Ankyrin repeat and fibronectin type-III domain-containing protein 1 n=1 Tax=Synaphobranchus kaupii TaxID=118154 RepID=A0A9Q1IPF9_SYNKA|nr:hypothetical protein SKAU_G00286160 [Synaphobranchus kaupii]
MRGAETHSSCIAQSGHWSARTLTSLGSADRKEAQQKKSESGISRFTQRLALRDRQAKPEKTAAYRRRSLSLDWADYPKMTQQMRETALSRKPVCLSSPSAARRLYRNLSGKFRVGQMGLEERVLSGRGDKAAVFQSSEALFEAVEHQELDLVHLLLTQYSLEELDLNTPNSEGLLPLDIAIMTNNVPMAKLLLQAGAKESPHFVSLEGRATHLETLLREAEQRVAELQTQAAGEAQGTRDASHRERQLKAWEWRHRLFKRMKTGFEHASPPEAPSNIRLSVSSSCSLRVTFQEPLSVNSAIVTKYKVGWSLAPSLCPPLGELVVEDSSTQQCTITGLVPGVHYYVQVSAYNMKGWGPPQPSVPACAAPSSWRDIERRAPRLRGQKEVLDQLLGQIKEAHQHCTCHEPCKMQPHVRKHSVSKSLRHIFQPTSKFVKTLKRGLYLTSIFYREDKIFVTSEDHIPMVEIEDSYSSSLMQDFLWFTKVSYLWEEIPWLLQLLGPSQSSCSCSLQTHLKMLQAVSHLQGMLGMQDLGRVYYEPIKDKHGNVLLVTLLDMNSGPCPDGMRWTQLCKLQLQRKSISSPEEPNALDMLLITLQEKLSYHRCSRNILPSGLYLGYLKLCSSVDQIRVLVPQKLPNMLCHVKIRDNSNLSREEWQWLQALSCLEESLEMDQDVQSAAHHFLQDLRRACWELMAQLNIPAGQAQDFRIYSQEVLEFGDRVCFLLLLPPSDDVCTAPGQNSPLSPRPGILKLPLQIFELVHFQAYHQSFMAQYCRVSALLELESLLSQQTLREAFSESEVLTAKQKHQQVQQHMQQMEEVWREVRWIMDALQHARYKQPTGGVLLSWIIDFSQDVAPQPPPFLTSLIDFLPSPLPSPEAGHKHNYDLAGLSDEDVFLPTDSDYDSSRTQSPRELDLLPASPCSMGVEPGGYLHAGVGMGGRGMGCLRSPAPDVLRTSEPPPAEPGQWQRTDVDFVLPSRQIELLRITEKRQALCVRTGSLELPPSPRRASPLLRPRPPPTRSLSEDSGSRLISAVSPVAARSTCYATLKVYPQYHTGLPTETSVKLRVSQQTSAREMVRLVVQEMNEVSQKLLGNPERFVYGKEQLEGFGLVLVLDDTEEWLRDDIRPLDLQNPWVRGRLCVRVRERSPHGPRFGLATTV